MTMSGSHNRLLDADLWGGTIITLHQADDAAIVTWRGEEIKLALALTDPFIRVMDETTFVLVDFTRDNLRPNAWVVRADGSIETSFHAGTFIASIVVDESGIWVGYGDEGIFGEGISTEALVCFSRSGYVLFRYNHDTRKAPIIVDCEHLVTTESGVWFFPSLERELTQIDRNGRIVAYRTPKIICDSEAMTIVDEIAYFVTGGELYRWTFGRREKPIRCGRVTGDLRGCTGGFLQINGTDVTFLRV
ncbi:hypothetical protein EVJ27_07570 [Exiguobacterium sp. SH3S2]|uniref:hypothetical protein n=1 Tax=unclassified Exiguobacterium TaxID=2644629 RepID=UPI00103CF51F|nr:MULTISPECIES: hypothetical protein [unclassified Exiguobacterium]TCI45719.1 hypothetical protein EVJ28_07570 [Exiguobacterium sp. SH3S3]TCI56738.1 hypothetical protein EVJ30_04255 [Exiguobacterium sp. SH5S13]TCI60125.1 hypothetical protein EVJ26_11680 [Exiguobacterium sp. SH3S1]TCI60928.1 hypothetical protein EVJ27_07570 [Exiguobacterium sp. SH3S2]